MVSPCDNEGNPYEHGNRVQRIEENLTRRTEFSASGFIISNDILEARAYLFPCDSICPFIRCRVSNAIRRALIKARLAENIIPITYLNIETERWSRKLSGIILKWKGTRALDTARDTCVTYIQIFLIQYISFLHRCANKSSYNLPCIIYTIILVRQS